MSASCNSSCTTSCVSGCTSCMGSCSGGCAVSCGGTCTGCGGCTGATGAVGYTSESISWVSGLVRKRKPDDLIDEYINVLIEIEKLRRENETN